MTMFTRETIKRLRAILDKKHELIIPTPPPPAPLVEQASLGPVRELHPALGPLNVNDDYDFWLHPDWLLNDRYIDAEALVNFVVANGKVRDPEEAWAEMGKDFREWMRRTLRKGAVPVHGACAYDVPILSEEACALINERSQYYTWEENSEEEEPYRIPEAILEDKDPHLHRAIMRCYQLALWPWIIAIWRRLPTDIYSVQMARYNPKDRQEGNWHIDSGSNMTAVISLDPTAHAGRGTEIRDGIFGTRTINPLAAGHGLLFDGRRVQHRGLAVGAGDRRLLVLWADDRTE